MFCSGCGQQLAPGQGICARCGRPLAGAIPPVPGFEFQLENYAGKLRTLSILWFAYAAVAFLTSFMALSFAHAFFSGEFGNFGHGPMPPPWIGPMITHFAIPFIFLRASLAVAAGFGLMERSQWGRVVAIVAAILSLLRFPFGTALGIWTLVMLLGYRNTTLYNQL
jgi:hypothetical protein